MIKIHHSIKDLDAMALGFYYEIQRHIKIFETIDNRVVDEATPVFSYLRRNLKQIMIGRPVDFEYHIAQILPLETATKAAHSLLYPAKTPSKVHTWYKNEILKVFNYDNDGDSFTQYNHGQFAYKYAVKLQVNTCPYCNSQFTFSIKKKGSRTRPHFDHFYCKKSYPYLALSFYNLIPACYVCNSSLKGQKVFSHTTHLHPYFDSMEGLFKFRTNISSVDFLTGTSDFAITLAQQPKGNNADIKRAKRNLKVFAIEDRYNYHKDIAGEIISKSHIYNTSTLKDLLEDYEIAPGQKLFSSEKEILELLLGNYLHQDKLHKRILSKLTRDIAYEFGLKV